MIAIYIPVTGRENINEKKSWLKEQDIAFKVCSLEINRNSKLEREWIVINIPDDNRQTLVYLEFSKELEFSKSIDILTDIRNWNAKV